MRRRSFLASFERQIRSLKTDLAKVGQKPILDPSQVLAGTIADGLGDGTDPRLSVQGLPGGGHDGQSFIGVELSGDDHVGENRAGEAVSDEGVDLGFGASDFFGVPLCHDLTSNDGGLDNPIVEANPPPVMSLALTGGMGFCGEVA